MENIRLTAYDKFSKVVTSWIEKILCIQHRSTNKHFCIKREYDITFLENFWVLISNLAFIFL